MNNVITILVDSVFSECFSNRRTEVSSTPFIDKLLKNSIYTPNMYSFGPYTNAATKGLFCSTPTLDDYGYYFGINGSEYNPYRVFKEKGYETYGFYYPYYLISNNTKSYIDHTIYTSGFIFSALWRGNFQYYQEIQKQRELKQIEYLLLEKFLDMMFDLWIEFYDDTINNEEARLLLDKFINLQEMKNSYEKLKIQKGQYMNEKKQYIDALLLKGMEHELAKIDCVNIENFADKDFIREVIYKENLEIIEYINKRTKTLNKKNNKINYREIFSSIMNFFKYHDKDELRILYNWYCCFNTQKKMIKDTFRGIWQEMPSAKTQIRTGINLLEKRKDIRPFYCFFHFLEVHERIAYFSYDRKDAEEARKEFKIAKDVAINCGDKFKGSLVYQMALRYIDSCIEELFDFLDKSGLSNNTTVMIIADHGSSYTYYPIRKNVVNSFHRENYNIPMVIWQKNFHNAETYNGFYTSMDAYPTLLELLGIEKPSLFKGKSVRELPEGREYVITEYMGPGCPDMLTKQAWFSIRNKKYMLAYKVKMDQSFIKSDLLEAYNLENDHYELKNIASKIDFDDSEIKFLIKKIEERFAELCENRNSFIKNIDLQKL